MTETRSSLRLLLLWVFTLSGFAGLIYQSVWAHYLGLFLGHAAFAQSLVLALFMGGMALGALLVSRRAGHWRNLVRRYAVVEAVIGVAGLLFHPVYTGVLGLSYDWIIPALGDPALVSAWRWLLAAALILPQSILLGMTFPLMSVGIMRRFPGQQGRILGGLYFCNSIGAACGVLMASFVLLPLGGLPGAIVVAGVLNLLVAALAWWLAGGDAEPVVVPEQNIHAGSTEGPRWIQTEWVLLATAMSGAASFVYEIVWVRMLSLAVGSTLHAFELMLAAFIAGIALGGLWVRGRADRSLNPLRLVAWLQLLMGIAALASIAVYAQAFGWVSWLIAALSPSAGGYALFNLGTAALALIIMLPAAFFAGTTLPLFTLVLLRQGEGERVVGRVYAWNTLGAIVGVMLAVHLLIPSLGLKHALVLAAAVDILVGLLLLAAAMPLAERFRHGYAAAWGLALGSVLAALMWLNLDPMRLASGVYRYGNASLPAGDQIEFHRDGKTASVTVVLGEGGLRRIATNGKVDAALGDGTPEASTADEPTMILAAAYPLAHHASARSAAVIGLGSGLTTHALLADPQLQRVDTIEIEPMMVEGARRFGFRVSRAYTDSRSRIIIDDAKSFFAAQGERYDLIISEPSNPWISGVGSLFSEEFYRFIPRHLNDDGLFLQWLQLYEIDDELVASVLAAMTPQFEDMRAWLTNSSDLLILARHRGTIAEADYQRLFDSPFAAQLHQINIDHPEQLAFRAIADRRVLTAIAAHHDQRANSDYWPVLSLRAPQTRFRRVSANGIRLMSTADVPVLEWLGLREPLSADIDLLYTRHFEAEFFTHNAQSLNARLRGQPGDPPARAFQDLHAQTRALLSLAADCSALATPPGSAEFVRLLSLMTAHTIPYLTAEQLRDTLIEPGWLGCEPNEALRGTLNMVAALAARDGAQIRNSAPLWLQQRPDSHAALDSQVLLSWQLALLQVGDQQGVRDAANEFEQRLPSNSHQRRISDYLQQME